MRILAMISCLAGVTLLVAGCAVEASDTDAAEDLGTAEQAQIDPGSKAFTIAQSGVINASSWAGPISASGGSPVEYWVAKPGYNPTAARTFTGTSSSCSDWKRTVCGSAYAGATYYKATFTQEALSCDLPPGPCTPPAGAVSFLGAGSYRTTSNVGGVPSPFAWTYSTGTCEYWANAHPITTGVSAQGSLIPGYSSLSQFESSVCAQSPVPTTFYKSYYEPIENFCSITTC